MSDRPSNIKRFVISFVVMSLALTLFAVSWGKLPTTNQEWLIGGGLVSVIAFLFAIDGFRSKNRQSKKALDK
jgi:hypothetical protein